MTFCYIFLFLDDSFSFAILLTEKIMEKTLVIIKPGAIQRELIGEVITRFERKGLQLCGIKNDSANR